MNLNKLGSRSYQKAEQERPLSPRTTNSRKSHRGNTKKGDHWVGCGGEIRCGLCGGGLVWGTHNCKEKQQRSHCSAVLSPPALSLEHWHVTSAGKVAAAHGRTCTVSLTGQSSRQACTLVRENIKWIQHLTKDVQQFYRENWKTLLRDVKGDLNQWRDKPHRDRKT